MTQRFRSLTVLLATGLGLATACKHTEEVVPTYDDYYPVVVGTYRSYAVQDSTWLNGQVSVQQFQLRERVAEQFTDAGGQPAFRLVRSRRATAAQAWADDSVVVVQKLPVALTEMRNNVRTVELLYPVRSGKGWNASAFGNDTTSYTNLANTFTRFYGAGAGATAAVPAAGAAPAKTYDATVLTKATLPSASSGTSPVEDSNVFTQRGLRQLYARGVGRVLRRRFYYETFTTDRGTGAQTPTPGVIQNGFSRRETLLETGTL